MRQVRRLEVTDLGAVVPAAEGDGVFGVAAALERAHVGALRVDGVSMNPGATATLRIPNMPSSLLQVTVIALTAALAAA